MLFRNGFIYSSGNKHRLHKIFINYFFIYMYCIIFVLFQLIKLIIEHALTFYVLQKTKYYHFRKTLLHQNLYKKKRFLNQ